MRHREGRASTCITVVKASSSLHLILARAAVEDDEAMAVLVPGNASKCRRKIPSWRMASPNTLEGTATSTKVSNLSRLDSQPKLAEELVALHRTLVGGLYDDADL